MISRIISGGQTGADQGALEAAKELGLLTGGWMPKGFRTDEGPRPEFLDLYGMAEHSSSAYPPRTELNVRQSGATLIIGNRASAGCRLTFNLCIKHNRSTFTHDWKPLEIPNKNELQLFCGWLDGLGINTLNVAGNRESKNPGIKAGTKAFLISALRLINQ